MEEVATFNFEGLVTLTSDEITLLYSTIDLYLHTKLHSIGQPTNFTCTDGRCMADRLYKVDSSGESISTVCFSA